MIIFIYIVLMFHLPVESKVIVEKDTAEDKRIVRNRHEKKKKTTG